MKSYAQQNVHRKLQNAKWTPPSNVRHQAERVTIGSPIVHSKFIKRSNMCAHFSQNY